MKENKNTTVSYLLKIMLALMVAVAGSLPFLIWPEAIKKIAVAGYIGLFIACFLTNATVLLPASGIAFTVSAAMALNPLYCTIIGGVGTACGELISYYCGRLGKSIVEKSNIFLKIQRFVDKYGALAVWLFAFLPLPVFDLVGIITGSAKMPLPKYMISCMIGKIMKMMVYVFIVQQYLNF